MKAFTLAVALIACAAPVAASPDSVPPSGSLSFGIWRAGARIGAHSFAFRQAGDNLIVEQHVDLAIRVGFVTLYRLSGKRLEVWRDGRLVQYDSETDDDGTRHYVRATLTEHGLTVQGDFGSRHLPADAVPFGLWNRAALQGVPIFNDETGTPMKLTVTANEGEMESRYRLTGDVSYVLRYTNAMLHGVKIVARDGSTVEYVPE